MRQTQRRRKRQGFMLIEAMIAMVLAALMIAYGLPLMMISSSAQNHAQQTTLAYTAARQAVENVRAFRDASLSDQAEGALIGSVPQIASLNQGTGTLTIATHRGPVKRVTVTIHYRAGAASQPKSLTLTTLVAPGGVTP